MNSNEDSSVKRNDLDIVENLDNAQLSKAIDKALASGDAVQMRSALDYVPTFKAIRIYWRISLICMLGAFAAGLDGYRKFRIWTSNMQL